MILNGKRAQNMSMNQMHDDYEKDAEDGNEWSFQSNKNYLLDQ